MVYLARDIAHNAGSGDRTGAPQRHQGHAHFWERALSRRRLVGGALGSAALVAGSGLLQPLSASAAQAADPKPVSAIDIGFGVPLHLRLPYYGGEASQITDFNGTIAAAEIQGGGIATNLQTGDTARLVFDADMRVMQGLYIGLDSKPHIGTFGFV